MLSFKSRKIGKMKQHIFAFEKLEVWKKSKELVKEVYKLTRSFPEEEKFGLTSQIRRSAVSVVANIAEGSGRRTAKDQARFTTTAYSSLIELLNHMIIALEIEFLDESSYLSCRRTITEISFMLSALHRAQIAR